MEKISPLLPDYETCLHTEWVSQKLEKGLAHLFLKNLRRGTRSLPPGLTREARTTGNNRSTSIRSAWALLVRLRRLGDSGGTQGNAKAEAAAAVNRHAPVAVRRPAIRGLAAPTAAPEHAERVRRGTNWIYHSRRRIVPIPVRTPFPYIPMHVMESKLVRPITSHTTRKY